MDDPKILIALNTILDTLGKMNTAPAVGDDSVTKNIVKSKGSTFDKQNSNEVDADQVRLSTEIAYKYLQKQEKPKSANLGRDRPRLTAEYTLFTKTFYKVMQQLKPDKKGETKVLDPAAKAALAGQEEMNRLLKQLASGKFGKGGPGGGDDPGGGLFDGIFDSLKGLLGNLLTGLGIGGTALGSRLLGRKARKEAKKQKKAQKKADRDKKKAQKKQDADKKKQQKKQDADKKKQPKKPKPDAKTTKPKPDAKTPKPDAKKAVDKSKDAAKDVTKKATKDVTKKGVVKTTGKMAAKIGGRFVPGVGWVLLAADVGMMAKGVYDVNKAWGEAEESHNKATAQHANLIDKIKADAMAKAKGGDPLGAFVSELRVKQQSLSKQYNDKYYEYSATGGFLGFGRGINDEEQAELDRLEKVMLKFDKEEMQPAVNALMAAKAARGDEKAQEFMRRNANRFEREKAEAEKRGAAIMKMMESGMSEDEAYKALGETAKQKKLREKVKLDAIINDPRATNMHSPQSQGKIPYAEDFMFRSGKFIKFDSKDDILGAKSGGALDKLISRSIPTSVGVGAQPVKVSNIDSITSEIRTSNAYLQALVKLTAKLAGGGSGGARAIPVPSGNDSMPKAQGNPDGPSMVDSRVEFYNSAYSMHTPGTLT